MLQPRQVLGLSAVLVSALLSGCEREVQAPTEVPRQPRRALTVKQSREPRPEEGVFFQIAAEAPSYAGHFLDASGTLTAYVADSGDFPAARAALLARLASGAIRLPKGSSSAVRILKGEYSLQQLSDWRDDVFELLLGHVAGVIGDDLDEAQNRVTVMVMRGQEVSAQATVLQRLTALGVPPGAIRFKVVNPSAATLRRAPLLAPGSTLGSIADSIAGGLRIEWTHDSDGTYGGGCTIGFTVQFLNGTKAFTTASHCSDVEWGTDGSGDLYYQPHSGSTVSSFGWEIYDPLGGTCPALWPCTDYRFSDASLNYVTTGNWRRGMIVRPASRQNNTSTRDTTVSTSHPYLYVVGTAGDVMSGQTIDKIGATTGWHYGTVTNTCWDLIPSWHTSFMIRCTYTTNALTDDGDSGGPVFTWDGTDGVTAYGMITAKDGTDGWFWKYSYINSELTSGSGSPTTSLNFLTDVTVAAPSIGISLSGNTPTISWSAVSTTNTTAATNYTVIRSVWDASTYSWLGNGSNIGSTTSTSYADNTLPINVYSNVGGSKPNPCVYSYAAYSVNAYNSGVLASSNVVYLQGDANGPDPNQINCQ